MECMMWDLGFSGLGSARVSYTVVGSLSGTTSQAFFSVECKSKCTLLEISMQFRDLNSSPRVT